MHRKAFTLIELLIVIAIISIIAVVVVLTLNPIELLRQSRDSNRVSDMSTLVSAIDLYNSDQLGTPGYSLGTANTVYVSIPDPSATTTAGDQCQGLGLLTLPATYTYHCAATSTFRAIDGTGWVPINFTSIVLGVPLSNLPVDPTNSSSSRLYYTYTTNGTQFEVTAAPESQKYGLGGSNDIIGSDGGALASVYENGSQLGLEPLDYGNNSLVGWWPLNEGTSSIAYDGSGRNATGSWSGTQAGTSGYYSPGKIGNWGGYFDGTDDSVATPSPVVTSTNRNITFSLWFKVLTFNTSSVSTLIFNGNGGANGFGLWIGNCGSGAGNKLQYAEGGGNGGWTVLGGCYTLSSGTWYSAAITASSPNLCSLYVNGALISSNSSCASGSNPTSGNTSFGDTNSIIDDVRLYNKPLSASQVAALYVDGR
jgi:prepilin-type N-terminal cleavage/methylation domain-containing protein